MAPPFAAAATLDPTSADAVAARWAALRALPLSEEPLTDEEREAFDEGERFLAAGQRGVPHAELERVRRSLGE